MTTESITINIRQSHQSTLIVAFLRFAIFVIGRFSLRRELTKYLSSCPEAGG
jgi:hypothetical protein